MNAAENALQQLIAQVAQGAPTAPEAKADPATLTAFFRQHRIVDTSFLYRWLRLCNGWQLRRGTLYGVGTGHPDTDINVIWRLWPDWMARRWLPIADNGQGATYVIALNAHGGGPVYCIDPLVNESLPRYVAASDLYYFVQFFLQAELGDPGWPYSAAHVKRLDPQIANIKSAPLPWERA